MVEAVWGSGFVLGFRGVAVWGLGSRVYGGRVSEMVPVLVDGSAHGALCDSTRRR